MESDTCEKAEFSFSTISNFDEHIATEIRGYDILDNIVVSLAEAVIESGTNVYDIGSSTGRLVNDLAVLIDAEEDESRKKSAVSILGFEPNSNFIRRFRAKTGGVSIIQDYVTPSTRFDNASLVTAIFTLQFMPMQHRQAIVSNIYEGLNEAGALILAEKVYSKSGAIESLLTHQHIEFKRASKSAEEILGKNARLRSVLRPLPLCANIEMLENAGFRHHEVFWRVNNFVAILAIKL